MDTDCKRCGLLDSSNGPVPDDGGDYAILVVGESPGESEDREGRPFVGRSGRLLRDALDELGYQEDKVTYTNVVRCRPPNNKVTAKYVNCCYRGVPIKDNTRLVLLLGNTPLKAVLGESGITAWNGVVVERGGIVYAPAFHPAYILRNPSAMDDWLDALDNALDAHIHGMDDAADSGYEYMYPTTPNQVYAMCSELLMGSELIAFDTEVAMLDAFDNRNRLLVVSFANDTKAWAVAVDHPDCELIDDESLGMICNVLENHPYIIGHNIKFDQMQCKALLHCDFEAKGDTMLLSFLVEARRGIHGLKRLAGRHLGMFDYDSGLRAYTAEHKDADYKRGGSYANIPLDILLPYAAKDALATFQLYKLLMVGLPDKQRWLYRELIIPTSNTLRTVQSNGMAVDYGVADRYTCVYSSVVQSILDSIDNDPMVQKYVADRKEKLTDKAAEKFRFNPGSWQQKGAVLYGVGYYALDPLGTTEKGSPSTKREYIEPYREECSLVDDLIMYGMLSKMLGTYIEPMADGDYASSDGRIRSSFNQHVVETGRLSSSNPNMQNIPVPEKEPGTILEYQPIKNMFTHTWSTAYDDRYRFTRNVEDMRYVHVSMKNKLEPIIVGGMDVNGGCLMAVDYAGAELRVFASLAKCQSMIDIHRSGKDFHTMVAVMAGGGKSEEDITKPIRYRYKWTNWTLLFGGSAYTLHRMYNMPLNEAEDVVKKYFAAFPEVSEYQQKCCEFAMEHGYIETPFGRRRVLPDIKSSDLGRRNKAIREAVNTPVQGGAGELTLLALTIVDKLMRDRGYRSLVVNTVHDSIVFDVYPGELDRLAHLAVDVMENIKKHARTHAPNLDMSWLICPMKADVEVGFHYGMLEHYNPI